MNKTTGSTVYYQPKNRSRRKCDKTFPLGSQSMFQEASVYFPVWKPSYQLTAWNPNITLLCRGVTRSRPAIFNRDDISRWVEKLHRDVCTQVQNCIGTTEAGSCEINRWQISERELLCPLCMFQRAGLSSETHTEVQCRRSQLCRLCSLFKSQWVTEMQIKWLHFSVPHADARCNII